MAKLRIEILRGDVVMHVEEVAVSAVSAVSGVLGELGTRGAVARVTAIGAAIAFTQGLAPVAAPAEGSRLDRGQSLRIPVKNGEKIAAILTADDDVVGDGTGYAPSGVAPVSGTFTDVNQSASFTPKAGRDFNIKLGTPGVAISTTRLERLLDGVWAPVTYIDGTILEWTTGVNSSWTESEAGVPYRFKCTPYTVPTTYRLSQ